MKANGIDTSDIVITKEDILSGKIFTKQQLMDSVIRLSDNLDKAIEVLKNIEFSLRGYAISKNDKRLKMECGDILDCLEELK